MIAATPPFFAQRSAEAVPLRYVPSLQRMVEPAGGVALAGVTLLEIVLAANFCVARGGAATRAAGAGGVVAVVLAAFDVCRLTEERGAPPVGAGRSAAGVGVRRAAGTNRTARGGGGAEGGGLSGGACAVTGGVGVVGAADCAAAVAALPTTNAAAKALTDIMVWSPSSRTYCSSWRKS
jgi:hypothetical protein